VRGQDAARTRKLPAGARSRDTVTSRYRSAVATIIPISDRRARLAFALAMLGLPSMGVTVPAAVWLGVGSVRQRRLSSGGEPAMGFIALVLSGLVVLTINAVIVRLFEVAEPGQAWTVIAVGVGLAVGVLLCTASTLRIHPERWGAVLAARTGLVASMAGGTALFARLLTVIG
jgi:hypothetical protein